MGSCKTDEDCSGGSGGQCQGISSSWPNTGKCSCRIPHRRMGNMKGPYLMENLFAPENLYKIAGAIHKEIHEIIDGINKKFDTAVRGVDSILNPRGQEASLIPIPTQLTNLKPRRTQCTSKQRRTQLKPRSQKNQNCLWNSHKEFGESNNQGCKTKSRLCFLYEHYE